MPFFSHLLKIHILSRACMWAISLSEGFIALYVGHSKLPTDKPFIFKKYVDKDFL